MSDLIDRKAAIDAVISLCDDCDSGYCGSCRVNFPGEKDARKVLEDLPPAQPEIIRCKDCKHYASEVGDESFALGWCPFIRSHLVMSDGFCAWAERKQNEQGENNT